ncbi:MAG: DUF1684 domain-containing protein [Chloracidobacterium sp.]|nr:DUF1684 domain-containing protein [Chloracidobacterium sp.]
MRLLFLAIFVIGLLVPVNGQTFYGSTDVKAFRDGRDHEFRNKEESPLKEEDLAAFKGLNYFPVDDAFRVSARFTRTPEEKYFQMPTSSGISKKFVKYGVLRFDLFGTERKLSVYQIDKEVLDKFPEYADLLFIPFRDATNRTETYAGGRYIDIRQPKDAAVVVNFNLAYNPNCAYGTDKYNCPIPPRENTLDVAITAGEKRFEYLERANRDLK